jgi:hypothetical protein
LKDDITQLIQTVKEIQSIENKLKATPQIGHLLVLKAVKQNIFVHFIPPKVVKKLNIIKAKWMHKYPL